MKRPIVTIVSLLSVVCIHAIGRKTLADYAETLYGKKGAELKTAIYKLTSPSTVLDYGSGAGKTWEGFYVTDRIAETNECIDRYSCETWYFSTTSTNSSITGMNIEHSFPKSWWGGTSNSAYKDLYNLMPCEAKINSSKSNYGMGVVVNDKSGNGLTKVGTGSAGELSTSLWEPADEWKGDFARGYMYMATAHQNLNSNYEGQALASLQKDDYPTLQQWAYSLYLSWAAVDKVSQLEVDRNNAVNSIQHNRNLFVDFPTLADYVWGDSIDIAFDPYTALTTCYDDERYATYSHTSGGGEGGDDKPVSMVIINVNFKHGQGDFTVDLISSSLQTVWTQTSNYGMKATGYFDGQNYRTEAWLISPEIDLTSYTGASLVFSEIVNKYFGDVDSEATLWVREVVDADTGTGYAGSWQQISYTHPVVSGTWSAAEEKTVDLSAFDGKKIYVGFKYLSTKSSAGTWEILNFKVNATKSVSGIPTVTTRVSSARTYNLSGQQVSSSYRGVVIRSGRKYIIR